MQPIDRNDTFHSALTEPIGSRTQSHGGPAGTPAPLHLPAYDLQSADDDLQVIEFHPRRGKIVPRARHTMGRGWVALLGLALLGGAFWMGVQSIPLVNALTTSAQQIVCTVSSATNNGTFAFCTSGNPNAGPATQPVSPPAQVNPDPQMPLFPRPHFMQPQSPGMDPPWPPCPPPQFAQDFPPFNCQIWP